MNTKKQGDLGVGRAISYFTGLGLTVSIPISDSQDYDLVVDFGNCELKSVQVKTSRCLTDRGLYKVEVRTLGGNQSWSRVVKTVSQTKVDYLWVSTPESDYLMPKSKVPEVSLLLGKKYNEFKVKLQDTLGPLS